MGSARKGAPFFVHLFPMAQFLKGTGFSSSTRGNQHIGLQNDHGFFQYHQDPYFLEYFRRQRNRNLLGLFFAVMVLGLLILLYIYG